MNENELLQQLASDVAQIKTDIALTKQAVMGNGVKGLMERMDDIEAWRHTHPRVCPLDEPPNPRKVNAFNVVLAIIGGIGVIGSLVVAVLK